MPLSLSCPGCAARLKAPDAAAGRTLRCPRCQAAIPVPAASGPAADFRFESEPADEAPHFGGDNPFEDDAPTSPKRPRPTAKPKPAEGYNPFDPASTDAEPAGPPLKRKYRKDADYNPFADAPADEVPDPAGDGFEFGVEAPPPTPTGDFDFGPHDPRQDDRRRR
jgi:hypothetical protein